MSCKDGRDWKEVFLILRAASQSERMLANEKNVKSWKLAAGSLLFTLITSVSALIIMYFKKGFEPDYWTFFGFALLGISYVSIFIFPIVDVWQNRKSICLMLTEPMKIILDNAENTARVDESVVPELRTFSLEQLEFVCLAIKSERFFLERRLSIIVGPIEKIGVIPGLLAAGVSFFNMNTGQPYWITVFACLVPVFYLIGIAATFLIMRLDRNVRLIELIVEQKKLELRSFS